MANREERAVGASGSSGSGGTAAGSQPLPRPGDGGGVDTTKCTIVEACACPLPDTEKGEGMSLHELMQTTPFASGNLRARILWADEGKLRDEWADRVADPKEWRVVGYGPGFCSYGLDAKDPGYANDHRRKFVEKKYCKDEAASAGGAAVPTGEMGGVVSVVVKPPGGAGEGNWRPILTHLAVALIGVLAGVAAGYARWAQ